VEAIQSRLFKELKDPRTREMALHLVTDNNFPETQPQQLDLDKVHFLPLIRDPITGEAPRSESSTRALVEENRAGVRRLLRQQSETLMTLTRSCVSLRYKLFFRKVKTNIQKCKNIRRLRAFTLIRQPK
jgi:hypothetical protein